MKYLKKISIIIPAYNEEQRLKNTVLNINDYFNNQSFEIIVVNDGSSDNTLGLIKKLQDTLINLKFISYHTNQGKGYAVKKGIKEASGEYILFLDADNSTPIEEFKKLKQEIEKGIDIAIGSRYLPNSNVKIKQSLLRIIIGRLGNLLIQSLLVKNIKDTQCGFKLFRHQVAKDIFHRQKIKGWGFDMEILAIAQILDYKIKEVAVTWLNSDDSRINPLQDAWKTFKELLKIKSNIIKNKYQNDF
jgi:dolichyl-phosphate beta-glucosyltransferase